MRERSLSGRPSSRMRPAESASGCAPHIARSFTVPCTASEPMSPPGKKSGLMTKESVENASRAPPDVEDRAVVQLAERGVVEAREEDVLDQALRQPAAAAVREENRLPLAGRDRAARREQRRAGIAGRVLRAHVALTAALA